MADDSIKAAWRQNPMTQQLVSRLTTDLKEARQDVEKFASVSQDADVRGAQERCNQIEHTLGIITGVLE